jgi:hypothetical protein
MTDDREPTTPDMSSFRSSLTRATRMYETLVAHYPEGTSFRDQLMLAALVIVTEAHLKNVSPRTLLRGVGLCCDALQHIADVTDHVAKRGNKSDG